MHISVIAFDGDELVELRVDDELWRGAFVPLDALPAAERRWVAVQARHALEAVGGAPLTASVRVELPAHIASARAASALNALLEAVQGCLLFGEATRGLSRRGRGDALA
jgi:hypothetical protein